VWCTAYALEKGNRASQKDVGTPVALVGPKADLTLDDPATEFGTGGGIERRFYLRLEDEAGNEKCACFLRIPEPPQNGLGIVQAPFVSIQIGIGKGFSVTGQEGTVNSIASY